jgi:hypothetical protein
MFDYSVSVTQKTYSYSQSQMCSIYYSSTNYYKIKIQVAEQPTSQLALQLRSTTRSTLPSSRYITIKLPQQITRRRQTRRPTLLHHYYLTLRWWYHLVQCPPGISWYNYRHHWGVRHRANGGTTR